MKQRIFAFSLQHRRITQVAKDLNGFLINLLLKARSQRPAQLLRALSSWIIKTAKDGHLLQKLVLTVDISMAKLFFFFFKASYFNSSLLSLACPLHTAVKSPAQYSQYPAHKYQWLLLAPAFPRPTLLQDEDPTSFLLTWSHRASNCPKHFDGLPLNSALSPSGAR